MGFVVGFEISFVAVNERSVSAPHKLNDYISWRVSGSRSGFRAQAMGNADCDPLHVLLTSAN